MAGKPSDPVGRILRRVVVDEAGCWLLPPNNGNGYARVSVHVDGEKRVRYAHVVMYESQHGPVLAGLQVDHLCRVTNCCNPAHLEAVTPLVNVQRSSRPRKELVCPRGHDLTVHGRRNSRGYVDCRTCENALRRERRRRAVA